MRTPDPAAYPNFDIYPPRAAIAEAEGPRTTKGDQCTIHLDLIPHYPNLVICKTARTSLILC